MFNFNIAEALNDYKLIDGIKRNARKAAQLNRRRDILILIGFL